MKQEHGKKLMGVLFMLAMLFGLLPGMRTTVLAAIYSSSIFGNLKMGDILEPGASFNADNKTIVLQADGYCTGNAPEYTKQTANKTLAIMSQIEIKNENDNVGAIEVNEGQEYKSYFPYANGAKADAWEVVSVEGEFNNQTITLKGYVDTSIPYPSAVYYRQYNSSGVQQNNGMIAANNGYKIASDTKRWTKNRSYVAEGNVTIESGVDVSGTVNLILLDGASLTVNGGINVSSENTLNIYVGNTSDNISGTGVLKAFGENEKPGIGADEVGNVNIHGGSITATGAYQCAGIGGDYNSAGGTVRIYDGTVNATGGKMGAGIGGGQGSAGNGGTVYIYGGTVAAAAGIKDSGNNTNTEGAGIGNGGYDTKYNAPAKGTLTLGTGVSLIVSSDNSSWSNYDGNNRKRYMKTGTVTSYNLWIGETEVAAGKLSGNGWTYVPDTATLTLNNFSYSGAASRDDVCSGIFYSGNEPLNIVLKGSNSISVTGPGNGKDARGIFTATALTLSGEGSLNVSAAAATGNRSSYGLYVNGDLTINSGTVNATGVNYGIKAKNIAVSRGSLIVKATGGTGYGIKKNNPSFTTPTLTIGSGVTSVIIIGGSGNYATDYDIKNEITGMGWLNTEGTGEGTKIEISSTAHNGDSMMQYKRLQFPEAKPVARVTIGGSATDYMKWSDAVTAWNANPGSTLTMLADITVGAAEDSGTSSPNALKLSGTGTLDLNGYTLSNAGNRMYTVQTATNEAKLIIKSSQEGGKITGCEGFATVGNYGTITLQSGIIRSSDSNGMSFNAGSTINLNGGEIECSGNSTNPANSSAVLLNENCAVNWSGTKITTASGCAVYGYPSSAVTINGGSYASTSSTFAIAGPSVSLSGIPNLGGKRIALVKGISFVNVTGKLSSTIPIGIVLTDLQMSSNQKGRFTNSGSTEFHDPSVFSTGVEGCTILKNADGQLFIGKEIPVTFKVVNGAWNEGEGDAATANRIVTLTDYSEETMRLSANQIPAAGSRPNDTYKTGSWDMTPDTETAITAATTYTYTYVQTDTAIVKEAPMPKTLIYNGFDQELVTAGTASGGEMIYALGTETSPAQPYTQFIPSATEAGMYYVWYKVEGDSNHKDSDPQCITVTISKGKMDLAIPATVTANNRVYDGTEKPLVIVTGEATGGTMHYAVTAENTAPKDVSSYTINIPNAAKAGTYYVWYMVVGDSEHIDSIPESVTVTITAYIYTAGAESTWQKESGTGLSFRIENSIDDTNTYDYFKNIEIDGKEVPTNQYISRRGSVIIELKPDYLETLSTGKHTIRANFKNGGSAETAFTIVSSEVNASSLPLTGDKSRLFLWVGLAIISLLGAGVFAGKMDK